MKTVPKTFRNLSLSIAAVVAVASVSWAGPTSTANLIVNGDFSADAALFVLKPGYRAKGENPASIVGWTWNEVGSVGLNGKNTAGRMSSFGPSAQQASPDRNWVFLQGEAAALYQFIAVIPGVTYKVKFEMAGRGGEAAKGSIYVVEPGGGVIGNRLDLCSDVNFEPGSFTFTPVAATSVQLIIQNPGGADSVNFTNISVVSESSK